MRHVLNWLGLFCLLLLTLSAVHRCQQPAASEAVEVPEHLITPSNLRFEDVIFHVAIDKDVHSRKDSKYLVAISIGGRKARANWEQKGYIVVRREGRFVFACDVPLAGPEEVPDSLYTPIISGATLFVFEIGAAYVGDTHFEYTLTDDEGLPDVICVVPLAAFRSN